MKFSLRLLILFLVTCVVCVLGAAVFVMLSYDLSILVAGNDVTFFSADFFLRALFDIVPFVCVFALMVLVMYLIRHPAKRLQLYVSYAIMCLVTWAVFLPLDIMAAFAYEDAPLESPAPADLSAGYFREYAGNVYFYSRTFRYELMQKDTCGEGLMIDLTGLRGRAGEVYTFTTSATVKPRNGYADTIFANATVMPKVVEKPVQAYRTLQQAARASWAAGIIPWIAFASIGLAFFSIIFIRDVNSWRFLNASVVIASSFLVFTVNAMIYSHAVLSDVSLWCSDLFFNLGHYLPEICSGVARVREPLALFVNIGFTIFYVLFGLICKKINSRRGNIAFFAEEEEE
ncbi:MAG: hypothetical protein IJS09_01960 [Treponema sp.]|nr:hypothetical protein [Treponema sp.]